MIITLREADVEKIGYKLLAPFGVTKEKLFRYNDKSDIDLTKYGPEALAKLSAIFEKRKGDIAGIRRTARDIRSWIDALNDAPSAIATSVRNFHGLLIHMLRDVPGHRIYEQDGDHWLCFYVNSITYSPPKKSSDSYQPAMCHVYMRYESLNGISSDSVSFYAEDCCGITVIQALARKGYIPETAERRANYLGDLERFDTIKKEIGRQYLAEGTAAAHSKHSLYWRGEKVGMMRDNSPSKVVIDTFDSDEEDNERRRSDDDMGKIDRVFWSLNSDIDAEGDDTPEQIDDDTEELLERASDTPAAVIADAPMPEIPVHPYIVAFDLVRHITIKIHVSYLTRYEFDKTMASKLVIDDEIRDLVDLLIKRKGGQFRDIVKGKAGGAVVLLAGPPGVGKTLTAEVFAESREAALYSVQCSQIGLEPEELEKTLHKIFARGKRWGAVVLLDEADVYLRQRGDDLVQNAIVGVFLRVLEYQDNTLFLTTNRPDDVDDAILSRCIAKIMYKGHPNKKQQMQIWRILTNNAGIKMSDEVIEAIVHNGNIGSLSGRDIKQILKLASLRNGGDITADDVEFASRFTSGIK